MYTNSKLLNNEFVVLQDEKFLKNQRIAGKVAAGALSLLENLVKEKTTKSLIELDKIAEEFIIKNECIPTFLHYKGFPNSVCISVNSQLVHGVPTDYKLQDGDIISFDLGATFKGSIADTAITCIFGEPKSKEHITLLTATKGALYAGIEAVKIGSRIGAIGYAIDKFAKSKGFKVIENFGGHGISITKDGIGIPHALPFISNKSNIDEGIRIQPGLTIAIEPLLVIGNSTKTKVSSDNWTVYCENICAHEEHTLYIHSDYVEIITDRKKNEN